MITRAEHIDEGRCPDCLYGMGSEGHDDEPCGQKPRCNQCDRPFPTDDRTVPLCDRCIGTAKAHARQEQDRIEWERDVVADPELAR